MINTETIIFIISLVTITIATIFFFVCLFGWLSYKKQHKVTAKYGRPMVVWFLLMCVAFAGLNYPVIHHFMDLHVAQVKASVGIDPRDANSNKNDKDTALGGLSSKQNK